MANYLHEKVGEQLTSSSAIIADPRFASMDVRLQQRTNEVHGILHKIQQDINVVLTTDASHTIENIGENMGEAKAILGDLRTKVAYISSMMDLNNRFATW